MECNVGKIDRIVRIIVAVITAVFGFIFSPWWFIVTGIALLTAIFGWCGLYKLFGANTCETKTKTTKAKVAVKKSAKKKK